MPTPSSTRALWRHFRPTAGRAFQCRCGRPVFFRNSICLGCGTALGYAPRAIALWPIEPITPIAPNEPTRPGEPAQPVEGAATSPAALSSGDASVEPGWWRAVGPDAPATGRWRRCANLDRSGCNWLLEDADPPGAVQCLACRLNRTLPDLSVPENTLWWGRIEVAKRRLVSSLVALRLPVEPLGETEQLGLAFDLLRGTDTQPVLTGHADGLITLNIEEADDARREATRTAFGEPYRTLLGHLRHETGHYYWQRLVDGGPWLDRFREVFGDERQDYGEALKKHHADGPPPDWPQRHVSAYASTHPWEDWAETWAHYLHMSDTLDTALSFGLDGSRAELLADPIETAELDDPDDADFLAFANAWVELTGILNELSRSMGLQDFYPFVLSAPAVRKLHLVHRIVGGWREAPPAQAPVAATVGTQLG